MVEVSEFAVGGVWREFSDALALTLSGMPAKAYLVVSASGGRYARFFVPGPELWCEVVHNDQLEGGAGGMSEQVESVLRRAGWCEPFEGRSVNWHRLVGWPVYFREYELVAGQVAVALHHGLQVGAPTELEIDSWIEGSDEAVPAAALEEVVRG